MYNRYLDTFLSVAEQGSFSKAAEDCHISRTALIQQMNILEDHFGFSLFTRSSKGVVLTEEGELIKNSTLAIKNISAQTIEKCLAVQGKKQVRIGVVPSQTLIYLTSICLEFSKQYPDIELQFVERTPAEYLAAFNNNEFDVSAEYMGRLMPQSDADYQFALLKRDYFECGMSPGSLLAGKKVIRPADLCGKKVALFVNDTTQTETRLRQYLIKNVPDIEIVNIESFTKFLPLMCINQDLVLIHFHVTGKDYVPLISRKLVVGEEYNIDIGLNYKTDARKEVYQFIEFAKEYVNGI